MIEWLRSNIDQRCGHCNEEIPKRVVHLEIRIAGVDWVRRRCEACGCREYGAPPADVVNAIAPQPSLPIEAAPMKTQAFVRPDGRSISASLARAQADFRQRQAGDD